MTTINRPDAALTRAIMANLQAGLAHATLTRGARMGEPLRDAHGHFMGWIGGAPHEIVNGMNARREATHLQERLGEHVAAKRQSGGKGISRLNARLTWKSGGTTHQGEDALRAHLAHLHATARSAAQDLSTRQLFDLKRSYSAAKATAFDASASRADRDTAAREMDAIKAHIDGYNQSHRGSKFDINA